MRIALGWTLLLLSACGGGAGGGPGDGALLGSCTVVAGAHRGCVEINCRGPAGACTPASVSSSCLGSHGSFSAAPCDRRGAVGGCRAVASNGTETVVGTTWLFPPYTAADVTNLCGLEHGTVIAP
jgi:hypothetical protein